MPGKTSSRPKWIVIVLILVSLILIFLQASSKMAKEIGFAYALRRRPQSLSFSKCFFIRGRRLTSCPVATVAMRLLNLLNWLYDNTVCCIIGVSIRCQIGDANELFQTLDEGRFKLRMSVSNPGNSFISTIIIVSVVVHLFNSIKYYS